MSVPLENSGAFPLEGPLTYMFLSPSEVAEHLAGGAFSPRRVWLHATSVEAARAIARQGIVPSCWVGGDSCGVFGYDSAEEIPMYRRQAWLVEVESAALAGQIKAWWVPPSAIRGAWHDGAFVTAAELRAEDAPLLEPVGCACELSAITSEQIACWRAACAQPSVT